MYTYLVTFYIEALTASPADPTKCISILVAFTVCSFLSLCGRTWTGLAALLFGTVFKKTLLSLLYSKIVKLPLYEINKVTPGNLVTIAGADLSNVEMLGWEVSFLFAAPISSLVSLYLLYLLVGAATFYCFFGMAFIWLLQLPLSRLLLRYRNQISTASDRRLGLVNTLLSGIQTIKNYAWGSPSSPQFVSPGRTSTDATSLSSPSLE